MTLRPTALLVAPTPSVAATFFTWLTDAGFDVTLVGSFPAGKRQLEFGPSLLVAEVRLGEFNGLHLALRAQAHDIPTIILGGTDQVLQQEARQLGAVYLSPEVERAHLLSIVEPITSPAWGLTATPLPGPTDVSFVSWRDCRPAVHPAHEPVRAGGRRVIPS